MVPLQIALVADEGRVHAIWLERGDALAGRLSYLLTDGRSAIPVLEGASRTPPLWLSWQRGDSRAWELSALAADGGVWLALEPDQERPVGPRYRLRWRPLASPGEQDLYFPR